MAFGKDDSRIGGMNLRQQMKRGATRSPRGAGKGGAPYYTNKYQPPDKGKADIIRIIPGQYPTPRVDFEAKDFVYSKEGLIVTDPLPYWSYIMYYRKRGETFSSCIGSEGPLGGFKGKGKPCPAADWYWWEWRRRQATGRKRPQSFSRREMNVFTVLVQAPFYKVPQTDRNGKPRINEKTGEPFTEWKQGAVKRNDDLAAGGYECKEGHLMHWSISYGHWQQLVEYSDMLSRHCRSCGNQDCIEEKALLCKSCGEPIVEHESTSLTEAELNRLRTEEVRCIHCGHTDFLEEYVICTECNKGDPATLFDVDLEIKRVHVTKDGNGQTNLQILRALGPRPIDPKYGDDLRKPLALDAIFKPTDPAKQIELFGEVPDDDDDSHDGSDRDDRDSDEEDEEEEDTSKRKPSNRGRR